MVALPRDVLEVKDIASLEGITGSGLIRDRVTVDLAPNKSGVGLGIDLRRVLSIPPVVVTPVEDLLELLLGDPYVLDVHGCRQEEEDPVPSLHQLARQREHRVQVARRIQDAQRNVHPLRTFLDLGRHRSRGL